GLGPELLDEPVLRDRHELGREVDELARLLLPQLPPRLHAHAGALMPAGERARVRGLRDADRPQAPGLRRTHTGHPASATNPSLPDSAHSSSAMCGAIGASSRTSSR